MAGFNTDPVKLRRSVQRQDALKRKLEKPLGSAIRSLFRKMADDLESRLIDAGQPIDARDYDGIVEKLLADAYEKTGYEFGALLADHIRTSDDDDKTVRAVQATALADKTSVKKVIDSMQAETDKRMAKFTVKTVPPRAADINRTTNKAITRAMDNAAKQIAAHAASTKFDASQTVIDMREFAEQVKKNFLDSVIYRGDMIAQTEIQNAAEEAKSAEVASFFDTITTPIEDMIVDGQVLVAEKIWVTMGDDKVRPSHADADFQIVDVGESFEVGGYSMDYPGDSTHGAPLDEIINCRCQSNAVIQ